MYKKGGTKMNYYNPNSWYVRNYPYYYRSEENNENEEQEWEIEKKFMDDMRKMMYQQLLMQKEILEKIHHIERRLCNLERKYQEHS